MSKVKQPSWCNYPEADKPMWGCWSLLAGFVKDEDYCKKCDCYRGRRRGMNKYVDYAFMGIGCGLVAYGVYLICQPLFFIIVGLECIVVALLPWKRKGGEE